MMRIILLVLVLCLGKGSLQAQSSPAWPKTLLWRISGNGLSNNSFLFGTMHLQDKRLFYFSDSLYHYLEQADGYALEIDLQEFMDSVIQKVVDQKQEEWIDKKRLKGKDKKKIIDSLVQNVKKLNDKASKRQLEQLRDEKVRKAMKNKEMPTIMDAYLYGIAKRQGKWLGGIEDVQDQLYLFDELGGEVTSEELLLPDAELMSSLEKMIAIYLAADLTKIENYTAGNYSQELENMIFLNRNIKMAKRMDSLAQVRSTFFSVGAAHLPGDSGVINLLKKKGYKLEPVFSSKKIDPANYAYKLSEVSWVNVEDEEKTYEVKMPGKASDLNMFDGAFKMKFYVDITTLTYYMSGSTFGGQNGDLSKVIDKFSENTDGVVLSKKLIEKAGLKGIEGIVLANDYYYKVQYFAKANRIYIMIAGGEKKEMLETPDVKKFLQSLVINKTKAAEKQKEWIDFSLEDKAFSIRFPGHPKQNKSTEEKAEGSEWTFTVYDYIDPTSGMYYMVQARDLRPGYYLKGDSAYFNSFRENLTLAIKKVTEEEITTIQSFPAYRFNGESEDGDIRYKTLSINRGNRVYTLFTGGTPAEANELDMDEFINSFTLREYKKNEWRKTSPEEKDFYTLAPVEIPKKVSDKLKEIPEENDKDSHFLRFNPNDAVSYEIFKSPLSPYYWIDNDSLFFDNMGMLYKKEKDSVLSKIEVNNGGLKGMEWVFQMPDNNIRKKIRQVLSGDTLYLLMSFIPSQYIYGREAAQFFEEFRITNEKINTGIYKSKAALIFKDLLSADSSTFANASEAISTAPFRKEDL
ncbi:MAG: TraB/GumN family protein, partial [Chitinophagaceae bacterium]